jgi:hypothetical protein
MSYGEDLNIDAIAATLHDLVLIYEEERAVLEANQLEHNKQAF